MAFLAMPCAEFKGSPTAECMGQILKAAFRLSLPDSRDLLSGRKGKKAQILGFALSAANTLLSLLTNNPPWGKKIFIHN